MINIKNCSVKGFLRVLLNIIYGLGIFGVVIGIPATLYIMILQPTIPNVNIKNVINLRQSTFFYRKYNILVNYL